MYSSRNAARVRVQDGGDATRIVGLGLVATLGAAALAVGVGVSGGGILAVLLAWSLGSSTLLLLLVGLMLLRDTIISHWWGGSLTGPRHGRLA